MWSPLEATTADRPILPASHMNYSAATTVEELAKILYMHIYCIFVCLYVYLFGLNIISKPLRENEEVVAERQEADESHAAVWV